MATIRIRTRLESDTPHLPELARLPDTEEALAARRELLRRWRADTRFAAYWPYIDQMPDHDLAHYRKWAASHEAVRQIQEDGGLDYDALRDQDACDLRHANDHI